MGRSQVVDGLSRIRRCLDRLAPTPVRGAARGSIRGPNDRPHPRARTPRTRAPRPGRAGRDRHPTRRAARLPFRAWRAAPDRFPGSATARVLLARGRVRVAPRSDHRRDRVAASQRALGSPSRRGSSPMGVPGGRCRTPRGRSAGLGPASLSTGSGATRHRASGRGAGATGRVATGSGRRRRTGPGAVLPGRGTSTPGGPGGRRSAGSGASGRTASPGYGARPGSGGRGDQRAGSRAVRPGRTCRRGSGSRDGSTHIPKVFVGSRRGAPGEGGTGLPGSVDRGGEDGAGGVPGAFAGGWGRPWGAGSGGVAAAFGGGRGDAGQGDGCTGVAGHAGDWGHGQGGRGADGSAVLGGGW